ncbi:hypothetical protein K4X33_03040 [Brevibacterium casei]|nr:hypothetical protein K4X33_03040 [Brevibacterium casei]
MNDSPVDHDSEWIPFGLFRPDIIESVPPKFFPTMVWGYFETEDEDGETGWIERTTEGASYATILSQIAGFLVETESANAWVDDDVDEETDGTSADAPVNSTLSDLSGDVLVEEASAALSRLKIYPLPEGHEPTGRYVAILCDDDPFESGNVELLNEDVSSELIEGLLRVAQMRFAETLSFSPFDDEADDAGASAGDARTTAAAAESTGPAAEVPPPPVTTFGDLFAGWAFLPCPPTSMSARSGRSSSPTTPTTSSGGTPDAHRSSTRTCSPASSRERRSNSSSDSSTASTKTTRPRASPARRFPSSAPSSPPTHRPAPSTRGWEHLPPAPCPRGDPDRREPLPLRHRPAGNEQRRERQGADDGHGRPR